MRFTIRDLLWLTVVVAALIGCKSRPAAAPTGVAPPVPATLDITKEQAIAIVRERIVNESPGSVYDCEVRELPDGFSVFVTYGAKRDAEGKLSGLFPGGHSTYRVSKDGKITEVMGGA
ncbi:MAG TPA: hypothetical protein VMP01_03150 [Pirellulaceae bacterium]|nr:hypothetical protein [Pirellulaceae bacterium]